jgi:hypothetical protein
MTTEAKVQAPVWTRPQMLGYAEAPRGLGGIVAPLLSGFSLAAIAAIVTASDPPPDGDWAVAALAATVALLLFSMQVAFLCLTKNSTPGEILEWHPEATVSDEELAVVRQVQASDFYAMARLGKISFIAYGWGLVAFHTAVLLLLVPHHWSVARAVGFGIVAAALCLELWWLAANRWRRLPHPVERATPLTHTARWDGDTPPELDRLGRASVLDSSKRRSAGLADLDR